MSAGYNNLVRVNKNFFECDCVQLAVKLLGKTLCVQTANGTVKSIITETEAYGMDDTACHCNRGCTKRNDPMFCKGGTVYVYLCYGLHEILNFAAGSDGEGQGVMIRGTANAIGPGRVTKAFGINRSFNYEFAPTSERIWVEEGESIEQKVEALKRVGIGYAAQEDQDRLWRFRLSQEKCS